MSKNKKDFFIIFHDEKRSKIRKKELSLGSLILFAIIFFSVFLMIFFLPQFIRNVKRDFSTSLIIQHRIDKLKNTEKVVTSLTDSINEKLNKISKLDSQIENIDNILAPDIDKKISYNKVKDSVYLDMNLKTHLLLAKEIELTYIKIISLYNKNNEIFTNLPTFYPVKNINISRRYGLYKDPYTNIIKLHNGVDFLGDLGDTVYASANGKIKSIKKDRYKGLILTIKHNDSIKTVYAHLDKALKPVKSTVYKGNPIALIGNSGKSIFPHLHFEIRVNDSCVDPFNYLIK